MVNLDMPVAELKAVLAGPTPTLDTSSSRSISADWRPNLLKHRPRLARCTTFSDVGRQRSRWHRTVAPAPALAIQKVVDREDVLAWWHGAGDLGSYVMKHQINVDGPLRENYVRGFLDTEADETWAPKLLAHLSLPLSSAAATRSARCRAPRYHAMRFHGSVHVQRLWGATLDR